MGLSRASASLVAVVAAGAVAATLSLAGGSSAWQGSFNASYQAAAPGSTIEVPAGTIVQDFPAEGAVKIRPAEKASADPITFVCKGDGDVIFPAGQFVITARNVVVRGSCFKMRKLWVGDPANGVSTSNVTVDGVSMESFDISGSDRVTVSNSTVGPSVGSSSNPRYYEPKVHDGGPGGGVAPTNILLDNLTIHDVQTLDPVQYHAGGLWVGYGPTGSLTIRNTTFRDNAIYDIHVDTASTGNLMLAGNTFGVPKVPLSQGTADVPLSQPDVEVKCPAGQPSRVLRNYTLTGNSWAHGWDLVRGCATSYENLSITGNTGGTTRNPVETASVTPPASCVAPTLGWKLPTRATITLTWPSVPDATGYRLFKNGVSVATAGSSATSAKFGSLPYADTLLGVAAICSDGEKLSSLTTFETRGVR